MYKKTPAHMRPAFLLDCHVAALLAMTLLAEGFAMTRRSNN